MTPREHFKQMTNNEVQAIIDKMPEEVFEITEYDRWFNAVWMPARHRQRLYRRLFFVSIGMLFILCTTLIVLARL